jgi:hypothetical protein
LNGDYRDATMKFFSWAPGYLDVADPTSGTSLGSRLTPTQRQNILNSFSTSYTRAKAAVDYETVGDHASAIARWRLVFGNEFPSYG